jgi:hypothetical protein
VRGNDTELDFWLEICITWYIDHQHGASGSKCSLRYFHRWKVGIDAATICPATGDFAPIEWLKFLRKIDRGTPKQKTLHLICDNYATHKHPAVQAWLNMVERFFRDNSEQRLRREVFTSVPELVVAIDEYIAHHNMKPKPFIWTKSARDILQKVIRANSRLSSKQNTTPHYKKLLTRHAYI